MLTVKNKTFDPLYPLICVPFTGASDDDINAEISAFNGGQFCDVIEWRADYYRGKRRFTDVCAEIAEKCYSPLIFTLRSKTEGGRAEMPEDERLLIIAEVMSKGSADFADVELAFADKYNGGGKLIISAHDFAVTPPEEKIVGLWRAARKLGASIVKGAFMPNSEADVTAVINAVARWRELFPDLPVIGISMGELGLRTRLTATGSCLTFAVLGEATAPGQVRAETVAAALHQRKGDTCG